RRGPAYSSSCWKRRGSINRKRENSSVSSGAGRFERRAASAGARRVRIHNVKARAGQTIAKIQSCAAQTLCALIVDEKLDAIALYHLVAGLFFIQLHFVVQARTTPSCNVNTEPFTRSFRLFFEQAAQLFRRVLGDANHGR